MLLFDDHVIVGGSVKPTPAALKAWAPDPNIYDDGIAFHPLLLHAYSNFSIKGAFVNKGFTHAQAFEALSVSPRLKTVFAFNTQRTPANAAFSSYNTLDYNPYAYILRYFYEGQPGCSSDIVIHMFTTYDLLIVSGQTMAIVNYLLPLAAYPSDNEDRLFLVFYKSYPFNPDPENMEIGRASEKGLIYSATFFLNMQCINGSTFVTYNGQTTLFSDKASLSF